MKKVNLLLAVAAASALLAGCQGGGKELFGFGGYATYNNNPAAYVGHTQSEVNYVAVTTNKDGKISKLRLDTVQINAKLEDGVINLKGNNVNGTAGDVKSKWELLGGYGMATASPTNKEWYQQAEAFENFAVGKTLAQVKGLVKEDHYLQDGASVGVTIHVDGFVHALEVALANTVEVSGKIDAIGVGGLNALSLKAPAYTVIEGHDYTIAGVAFSKDKKVLAARIDTFQIKYVATEGVIDVNEAAKNVVAAETRIKGKQELGDLYDMRKASPIGKEWFEQAAALVALINGKDIAETLGTAAKLENGVEAGVTMTISGYRAALLEAQDTAFNSRVPA